MPDHDAFAEIAAVVGTYVEGMCRGNTEKLRLSMHAKACSIGHFAGGLEWDDREAFIAAVAAAVTSPDPAPWFAIHAIRVTGDIAAVEVEDVWLGDRYTDLLTMLRHEGRWVIVSKVFLHLGPA